VHLDRFCDVRLEVLTKSAKTDWTHEPTKIAETDLNTNIMFEPIIILAKPQYIIFDRPDIPYQ
jgi:hypothetical protein